mmetsp:Transcript_56823/g.176215  ORF Transcript_56823/g.176215 Transcript_56823/m.176215 type:complete len:205 (-) Transcript_56823:468-1082(-)
MRSGHLQTALSPIFDTELLPEQLEVLADRALAHLHEGAPHLHGTVRDVRGQVRELPRLHRVAGGVHLALPDLLAVGGYEPPLDDGAAVPRHAVHEGVVPAVGPVEVRQLPVSGQGAAVVEGRSAARERHRDGLVRLCHLVRDRRRRQLLDAGLAIPGEDVRPAALVDVTAHDEHLAPLASAAPLCAELQEARDLRQVSCGGPLP